MTAQEIGSLGEGRHTWVHLDSGRAPQFWICSTCRRITETNPIRFATWPGECAPHGSARA